MKVGSPGLPQSLNPKSRKTPIAVTCFRKAICVSFNCGQVDSVNYSEVVWKDLSNLEKRRFRVDPVTAIWHRVCARSISGRYDRLCQDLEMTG